MSIRGLSKRFESERGVVAVFVAFLMVVLAGSAAMTFDLARLRHERHIVQAAVDLGSLAGASLMPVSGPAEAAAAYSTAMSVALANAPGLTAANVIINFACIVTDPEHNGGNDSDELRYRCWHATPGTGWPTAWTTRNGKAIHDCDPYAGDMCNTIRVTASSTIGYYFAPLLGFNTGSTGAVRAASCKGCGPMPIDMVFIVDRTRSMSSADVLNVKRALGNPDGPLNSVLEFYDPANVRIGLIALPYKEDSNPNVMDDRQDYQQHNATKWRLVGLSRDYRLTSGNLNMGSLLVQRVVNMGQGNTTVYTDGVQATCSGNVSNCSSGHTDYGDPIEAAQWMLENDPLERPDVPDVIVFMGDGEANQPQYYADLPGPPSGREAVHGRYNPCAYANNAATAAKAPPGSNQDATTIFALAYGAGAPSGGGSGENPTCMLDWSPSPFAGAYATSFFAAVASPLNGTPSDDNAPGGCAADENTDGDYYFCEERGDALSTVFLQIASATMQHSQLVDF